jgi:molybdenum cofactor cytidylyltransferase
MITFTGAGGKTSALRRLQAELTGQIPFVITTTTHIGQDQFSDFASHLVDEGDLDLAEIAAKLEESGRLLWTGPAQPEESKWRGIAPERIDAFKPMAAGLGAVILVEGDGARRRLLKAPAAHEPVIPGSTDVVVPLAHLDAVGQPLDETSVHRPELVAAATSLELGGTIGAGHLIELLTSNQGGLKGVPSGAEVRLVLNGVSEGREDLARAIARGSLKRSGRIRAAVLANFAGAEGAMEAIGRVAGVILAAGGASRMQELKQLKEWRGKPLIEYALTAAREAGLDPIAVVVGHDADRLEGALSGAGAGIVVNPDWRQGQSTSMIAGLNQVAGEVEAVVFLLADMPLVNSDLIERLVRCHQQGLNPIIAPRAGNRFGNPVLFDRATFAALGEVRGDRGGRALYEQFKVAAVQADESTLIDVDTEDDWDQLEDW